MGIFSEETKTSISLYIENLSNCEEIEWYQFQQLTESISMQPNGGREAIEAVRKRLKHGTPQQKLRVLEVLKLLMENSNQRFHKELICNEKMTYRFEMIIESSAEDMKVRKMLVMLLGTWASKYKSEQGMQILQRLYEKGRSVLRQTGSHDQQQQAHTAYADPTFDSYGDSRSSVGKESNRKKVPPPPFRNPPANQSNSHSLQNVPPPNDIGIHRQQSTSSRSAAWDFEKAKPKIMQEVALANQSANNLINALRLINTIEVDWEGNMRRDRNIQHAHQRCEEERKKIVRYARLVEDEEWIGTLLAANEELLRALDMYDIMLTGQIPSDLPTLSSLTYRDEPLSLLDASDIPNNEANINSDMQLTDQSGNNTQIPRDQNGQILEDPFADPI